MFLHGQCWKLLDLIAQNLAPIAILKSCPWPDNILLNFLHWNLLRIHLNMVELEPAFSQNVPDFSTPGVTYGFILNLQFDTSGGLGLGWFWKADSTQVARWGSSSSSSPMAQPFNLASSCYSNDLRFQKGALSWSRHTMCHVSIKEATNKKLHDSFEFFLGETPTVRDLKLTCSRVNLVNS